MLFKMADLEFNSFSEFSLHKFCKEWNLQYATLPTFPLVKLYTLLDPHLIKLSWDKQLSKSDSANNYHRMDYADCRVA